MFGDNFGGGGFSGGGGFGGGYDYAGGCSYQPAYAPVHVPHYHEEHFAQPCYDDSFNDPVPIPAQAPEHDSYDDVYDARADIPLPAEHAGDPLAHNATTASHRLGASSGAEAQALMERVVNEAIAAQERHMAQEAAEAAAEAAALADASKPGLFAKIRGVFFGLR